MTHPNRNCGEATIALLEAYGVERVYGVPGVHTLEFCRGLNQSTIEHTQVRHEQGAGFMADGYARTHNQPGVALVISGPGVTNALTALGQSYADSIPVLLLSADAHSETLGKGWGVLHEVPDLCAVTAPLTGFSAVARRPEDVPQLIAQAFTLFSSQRPRPVHIAIPTDVQEMPAGDPALWQPRPLPQRPVASDNDIAQATALLHKAKKPVICLGGGASHVAPADILGLATQLDAPVIASCAAKGVLPDDHPLSLSASTVRPEVQALIGEADVILAVGTELSETDSFIERLPIHGDLIRVDIDPSKIHDCYPACHGIVADSADAVRRLRQASAGECVERGSEQRVARIKADIAQNLSDAEKQHQRVLHCMRAALPADTVVFADACQLGYTGAFAFDMPHARQWHYASGYCTLGFALPNAMGAKLGDRARPVLAIAGDGGFMFTVQELMSAAEAQLPLPIVIWRNGGLKQIQDDMDARDIRYVGVTGQNPNFVQLAAACGCHAVEIHDNEALGEALTQSLTADAPTLILIDQDDAWLCN